MQELWIDIRAAGWMQRFVWANVALFLVAALTLDDAATAALFFLFVAGLVTLVRNGRPRELSRPEIFLLAGFAGYFLVGVLAYNLGIKTRLGWEILFRDIRFLFAIPAWIAVRRFPPPVRLVWSALLLGAFGMLAVAVANYLSPEEGWRAHGATISIVFGHLGVGVALVCAAGAVFLASGRWRWALPAGVLAAVVAVVLSGTRGAWLALGAAGGLLGLFWWWRTGWRQRAVSVLVLALVAVAAAIWLYKPLAGRVQEAVAQWQAYWQMERTMAGLHLPERGCVNAPEFLQEYSRYFHRTGRDLTRIEVVPVTGLMRFSCPARSAIRLQNTGGKSDWPSSPYRSLATPKDGSRQPAEAVWLVRGQGRIQFGGTRDSRREIAAEQWERLVLRHSDPRRPGLVTFILRPGERLELVPVQQSPGEYTMFHANSSVASRLEMWKAAWRVFQAHPVLGAGTGAWQRSTAPLIAAGTVSAVVARYDHAHNEYLTLLADRGLAGLLTLFWLYGGALWLFTAGLRRGGTADGWAAATGGLLLVAGFMISGLTETLFNHSLVITYYCLFVAILAAVARHDGPEPR